MIEKSTIEQVFGTFMENPSKVFHLRELSRLVKFSMPTIVSTTDSLAKEKLLVKTKGKVLTTVKANRENINFIRCKRLHNLESVYLSGIVDYISSSYNHPRLVILFGSYSRGEDIERSDIDIAVITNKKLDLDLAKFEKYLGRTITMHEINVEDLSSEFKANLTNGVVLEGSW